MKTKSLWNAPWHLAAFVLYFPLALYSLNIEETVFASTQRAFLFALGFSLIAVALGVLMVRGWRRAAAMASWIILLFFTYGHVQNILQTAAPLIGRHRYLLLLWLGLLAAGWQWIRKTRPETATAALNTVALTLLAFNVMQISAYQIRARQAAAKAEVSAEASSAAANTAASLPDVYYIIFDSYARQDTLQEVFGLDTSEFIRQLEGMGFVIPRCAQSNYDDTVSSLVSSLNMAYLEDLGLTIFPQAQYSLADMETPLKHSLVRRRFEEMGYATVTFKSVYPWMDIADSTHYYDLFLEGDPGGTEALSFYYLFLRTTAALPLVEYSEAHPALSARLPGWLAAWLPTERLLTERNYRQYRQNLYLLDVLKNMADLPGPKFVYAHLFTTHQPFVFTAEGKFRSPGPEDGSAYRDQVIYTNKAILEIVTNLLERSARPPVIVIQGDHSYAKGPRRVQILNAYYLPGGGGDLIYPTITPVNTFRVIFNHYFGGSYPLLEDISYTSTKSGPLIYSRVDASCIGNLQP